MFEMGAALWSSSHSLVEAPNEDWLLSYLIDVDAGVYTVRAERVCVRLLRVFVAMECRTWTQGLELCQCLDMMHVQRKGKCKVRVSACTTWK